MGLHIILIAEGEHTLVDRDMVGVTLTINDTDTSKNEILHILSPYNIKAVIGTDDSTITLAATIAHALGLPHNHPQATTLTQRKDLARQCLNKVAVNVPHFKRINLHQDLAGQIDGLDYPIVLKPLSMSGSRGVIRVNNNQECIAACNRIAAIIADLETPEERAFLLAEDFVPGSEVAVEAILDQGCLSFLAIFDKPEPLDGPYFEETYYITPAKITPEQTTNIQSAIETACQAYGLRHGPIHAEIRINDKGVWIIEIAARTIGGLCARLFEMGTGQSLEEVVLLHALGKYKAATNPKSSLGVLMIPIPEAGVLRRVEGILNAQHVRYVEEVVISVREGYQLTPLPEGDSYLGFIFAKGPSTELVEQALRQAHSKLNIVVAPLWKAVAS